MSNFFLNAVLNVQSDKITLLLCKKDGAILRIVYRAELPYDGYTDGRFFDETTLKNSTAKLIIDAEAATKHKIRKLLVGVPGEFTPVVTKQFEKLYSKIRKLTEKDIERAHQEGDTYTGNGDYTAINCSPVFYMTSGQIKLQNPVGVVTNRLVCNVSYVLMEGYFKAVFDEIGNAVRAKISYCSAVLAEAMFVVPQEVRDKGTVIVDSDFMSTTVTYVKGDGILFSTTFPLGSAYIHAGIMDRCDVPYEHCAELVKKINLNVKLSDKSVYSVLYNGVPYKYSMLDVNEVCFDVLKHLSNTVNKAMLMSTSAIPDYVPIVLTGAGVAEIIGAKEIMETVCNRPVAIVTPTHTELTSPKYASLAGLMVYSILFNNKGFLDKILPF